MILKEMKGQKQPALAVWAHAMISSDNLCLQSIFNPATRSVLQTPPLRHSAGRAQTLPGRCHLGLCDWIFLCLLVQTLLTGYHLHGPSLFMCLLHMS